jgi:hypothetical protein
MSQGFFTVSIGYPLLCNAVITLLSKLAEEKKK